MGGELGDRGREGAWTLQPEQQTLTKVSGCTWCGAACFRLFPCDLPLCPLVTLLIGL